MRPPEYHPTLDFRPARGLVVRLAVLIVFLIAALQSISFYVESLWYGSLGFESVFWYRLKAQSAVFVPVLESAASWFLAIGAVGLIAAILLSITDFTAAFKGVSLVLSLLLIAVAFQTYVGRYTLLVEENSLFTGVRYVDENIVIPGLSF